MRRSLLLCTLLFSLPAFSAAKPELEWQNEWDKFVALAIVEQEGWLLDHRNLPMSEIANYCPKFKEISLAEKSLFWSAYFSAIAKYESGFNPNASSREGWFDEETKQRQMSQGLLQLSYTDRKIYSACKFDRKIANIFDPETNLRCGVGILRKQIERRATLFPEGRAFYWSVLTRAKTKENLRAYFQAKTKAMKFCQVN